MYEWRHYFTVALRGSFNMLKAGCNTLLCFVIFFASTYKIFIQISFQYFRLIITVNVSTQVYKLVTYPLLLSTGSRILVACAKNLWIEEENKTTTTKMGNHIPANNDVCIQICSRCSSCCTLRCSLMEIYDLSTRTRTWLSIFIEMHACALVLISFTKFFFIL